MDFKIFFYLLFILNANSAPNPPDCRSVNLFDPLWGKAALAWKKSNIWREYTKQIPIYDQGYTPLCYAYTAAQMVDFWRITKGTRVTREINLSTPLYAGLLYRMEEPSESLKPKVMVDDEGGNLGKTLLAIKKGGCVAQI